MYLSPKIYIRKRGKYIVVKLLRTLKDYPKIDVVTIGRVLLYSCTRGNILVWFEGKEKVEAKDVISVPFSDEYVEILGRSD